MPVRPAPSLKAETGTGEVGGTQQRGHIADMGESQHQHGDWDMREELEQGWGLGVLLGQKDNQKEESSSVPRGGIMREGSGPSQPLDGLQSYRCACQWPERKYFWHHSQAPLRKVRQEADRSCKGLGTAVCWHW